MNDNLLGSMLSPSFKTRCPTNVSDSTFVSSFALFNVICLSLCIAAGTDAGVGHAPHAVSLPWSTASSALQTTPAGSPRSASTMLSFFRKYTDAPLTPNNRRRQVVSVSAETTLKRSQKTTPHPS